MVPGAWNCKVCGTQAITPRPDAEEELCPGCQTPRARAEDVSAEPDSSGAAGSGGAEENVEPPSDDSSAPPAPRGSKTSGRSKSDG